MKFIDPEDIRIDVTKELAKEMGFIETIYVKNTKKCLSSKLNITTEVQEFDYLIVIDFESTCWKERNVAWKQPEIIEFPAVLLNARTGVVEEEFQQYVMPVENKLLSEFCVKFTGIQQEQVDNGVPLGTCLLLFSNWIKRISKECNITFHKAVPGKFVCTFVTWSDWDLAMCLHNECQRKNIKKPEILCQWIDLKAVYKEFYQRNPKGLRGALSEVGLNFEGREHSGLSDAKNTAHLAWQMIQHGAKLRITKVLQPVQKISSSMKTSLQTTLKNHFVVSKNISKRKTLNTSDDKENILAEAKEVVLSSNEVTTPLTSRRNTLLKFQSPGTNNSSSFHKKQKGENNRTINISKVSSKENGPLKSQRKLVLNLNVSNLQNNNHSATDYKTPETTRSFSSMSCKRTPPLCNCGRRAIRRFASLPGPNQGRSFYTCSKRKSLGMVHTSGCGFFRWEQL